MSEITFYNSRFDPYITPFQELSMELEKVFGHSAELKIDQTLAQLLRLRVAQKNQCAYCVILHAKTTREMRISPAKVDNISSWWNSDLYSDIEKAALQYTDALSEGTHKDFQSIHDELTIYFCEEEIAEIAAVVINMNLWTRLKLAQGATPHFGC